MSLFHREIDRNSGHDMTGRVVMLGRDMSSVLEGLWTWHDTLGADERDPDGHDMSKEQGQVRSGLVVTCHRDFDSIGHLVGMA
jgi:hypothetical protein